MAVTKIHGIKTTVDKAIEYICNPDKTDQNLYISSFACSPETAVLDFKYTLDHTHDCRDPHNTNKAFHLIQAFSPGEVSYEEAHQIGKELADRLLEGKYSYVLTTHTDKGHVHNHLIFCSADNITFSHYHDCKKNYWKIRNLSDTLCQEHNLSTIMPDGKKGMKYNESVELLDNLSGSCSLSLFSFPSYPYIDISSSNSLATIKQQDSKNKSTIPAIIIIIKSITSHPPHIIKCFLLKIQGFSTFHISVNKPQL